MQGQEKRGAYRPAERTEPVKRLTLEISQDDWDYITRVSPNRTKWINEAIKAKRKAEESVHRSVLEKE